MNPTARRNARQYALQAMYQWQLSGTPITDIELEFLVHHIKQKTDLDYFKELIHAISKEHEALDNQMKPFLSRPLHELDPVELAILRLGIYELANRPDIPYRVAINEALELAKTFGSVEGHKFVNGILDQIARKLRTVEIEAHKKS
ncbi:MAG TPA: transcription antitermination factor NusB [Gammaproteobacteria bacterium]|nr:transcription antitermination factor NusB [Gammaproteobacteria bacterium]